MRSTTSFARSSSASRRLSELCRPGAARATDPRVRDAWNAVAMLKCSVDASGKGWFAGPWDSSVPVAVGWADVGVDEPHAHDTMHEIYLVARGTSSAVVNGDRVELQAGDLLVVEPGELHTFAESSDDYLHFVVQAPFVEGDKRIP